MRAVAILDLARTRRLAMVASGTKKARAMASTSRRASVTGEVPRTSGYEPGLPPQQAWLGGRWEPDPLVLDEQALIVDIKDKGLLVITGFSCRIR